MTFIMTFIMTLVMNHDISWRNSPWLWGRALHCLFADSGFRVAESGFQIRASGFGLLDSGFQITDLRLQIPCILYIYICIYIYKKIWIHV